MEEMGDSHSMIDKIHEIMEKVNYILADHELDDEENTSRPDEIYNLKEKYPWKMLQEALFQILLDDEKSEDDYYQIAVVFWYAALDDSELVNDLDDSFEIDKDAAVGLLYYRLDHLDEDVYNLIWSIASKLYGLNYSTFEYEPLEDPKIIKRLEEFGISLQNK